MDRKDLSLERQLVLMASIEVKEERCEEFKEIINNRLDWADVLFQMITHRTINMFCYNLKKFKLFDMLEKEVQRLLQSQWQVYSERNNFYLNELALLLQELEKYNIVVPVLKGNLLASIVYPAIETRIFNDLDLIIRLDDIVPVTKALEKLGYVQGHYDEERNEIIEATRQEKILQQMTSHELQEFQKLSSNKFAGLVQVDVNHDILWKGNCPYKVDTRDLIARALPVEINHVKGYMLDYIDNIIQLSCHLYKEATLMIWITDLRDLKIYKFADLFMYISKFYRQIDWEQLTERVKAYNLEKVIYYNFHYIEMMFGKIIPADIMADLKPADLSYLDEYGIENKEPSVWEFDFFTRLFDTNRVLGITQDKLEGMSRYLDAKIKSDGVFHHRTNLDNLVKK
jgi:hypothetical protein